jgi:hypothetical protein
MTHVTDDFSKLTGKQPAEVEDYLQKHQHFFTEAREA